MKNDIYPSKNVEAITRFLFFGEEECNLNSTNLVVVLGNDMIEGTVEVIHHLFKKGVITENAKIILSGATGMLDMNKAPECDRLYDCATQNYGMSPDMFIKEHNAQNAKENFEFSKRIIEDLGGFETFDNILCIGKSFLLRRASMYASLFGYPEEKMQYFGTVDSSGRNISKDCWWERQESRERVLAEIKRIGEYGIKGDLSIF